MTDPTPTRAGTQGMNPPPIVVVLIIVAVVLMMAGCAPKPAGYISATVEYEESQ